MRIKRHGRLAAVATVATLVLAGAAAAALVGLPADGSQVNNDPANGIDPNQDAGVSDVQGGTVVAGNLQVPWATFEQKSGSSQQIFVRAFKAGAWVTQGFPASLNLDPTVVAEAPSIDFAGAGRTVPWVAWYEPNGNLTSKKQIFASRFSAASNVWLPSGQERAPGHSLPSLNINPNRDAENPAVAGGAAVAGNDPVPWVAWQELDGAGTGKNQIFVSRAVKQAAAGTACPNKPITGTNLNINGFCWLQVGLERLNPLTGASSPAGDPTVSVDPMRDAIEPDDAFTGPSDTVPWVVWYEQNSGTQRRHQRAGVRRQGRPRRAVTADGGFHWVAVGNGTAGADQRARHGRRELASAPATPAPAQERACSLNKDATVDAEDPRVAAGTLTPGGTTVPWVVWSETIGAGRHGIFVSRLVGGDHFELFNQGQPVSNTLNDATRPDIAFSGNTPYITWQENVGGQRRTFSGHFEGGATAPVFKLDTPAGIARAGTVDLRPPVSSTCTANPTNADGSTCQAAALGTPFFLFVDGAVGAQHLFADAYAPSDIATGPASAVNASSATVAGSVNPGGARIKVHFDYRTYHGLRLEHAGSGDRGRHRVDRVQCSADGPARGYDNPLPRRRLERLRRDHGRRPEVHDVECPAAAQCAAESDRGPHSAQGLLAAPRQEAPAQAQAEAVGAGDGHDSPARRQEAQACARPDDQSPQGGDLHCAPVAQTRRTAHLHASHQRSRPAGPAVGRHHANAQGRPLT